MVDQREFAQLITQALRDFGFQQPLYLDRENFSILLGDGEWSGEIYLSFLFQQYEQAAAEDRQTIIASFVKSLFPLVKGPDDYSTTRSRLSVCVRHSATFEEIPGLMHWDLTSELSAVVVDDRNGSFNFLPQTQLTHWQVDQEVCVRAALENLAKTAWPLETTEHIILSRAQDNNDAARLLLQDRFRTLPLAGDPVILVPDRDCLVITGSQDLAGLQQVADLGHARMADADKPISGKPWVLRHDTWVEFEPPESLRAVFGALATRYDQFHYSVQTNYLRNHRISVNDSAFVADVLMSNTANRIVTRAWWPSGGPILLPKVEQILLYDQEAGTVQITLWADLFRVLGAHMTPALRHPIRYRVECFPTAEQRQAIEGPLAKVSANLQNPFRPRPH